MYQVVKGIGKTETEDENICHMLVSMGSEAVPIHYIFDDKQAKRKLKNAIEFFDPYFEPVKNVIFERSIFEMKQEPSESIHSFIV